ncbi:hypothetical protein [Rhodoblastus sp.]|uniref:hypothetical protein n=1 Tax=Rhodoblastus sp. TaxID=1962975 RepID=UPI003F965C9C
MWFHKAVLLTLFSTTSAAWAGEDATIALGRSLLAENDCNGACHQKHSPDGNALTLYTRPNPKVKDLAGLRKQVERCVASLNAPIAPDEIGALVAALNHDYYMFK